MYLNIRRDTNTGGRCVKLWKLSKLLVPQQTSEGVQVLDTVYDLDLTLSHVFTLLLRQLLIID